MPGAVSLAEAEAALADARASVALCTECNVSIPPPASSSLETSVLRFDEAKRRDAAGEAGLTRQFAREAFVLAEQARRDALLAIRAELESDYAEHQRIVGNARAKWDFAPVLAVVQQLNGLQGGGDTWRQTLIRMSSSIHSEIKAQFHLIQVVAAHRQKKKGLLRQAASWLPGAIAAAIVSFLLSAPLQEPINDAWRSVNRAFCLATNWCNVEPAKPTIVPAEPPAAQTTPPANTNDSDDAAAE